jgi:predicted transcriptional regulator
METMACIDSEGELIASARAILEALSEARTPENISDLTDVRLFRVRSMLREMQRVGLVSHSQGRYSLTEAGRARLEPQAR